MTRWFYLSVALAALAAAGSLYVYAFHYDRLPAQLPVHWNLEGEPDGWLAKGTALVLWPALAVGVVLLTLVLPWLSPRHFDVEPFRDTYGYLMALVTGLVAYLHLVNLWGTLSPAVNREHKTVFRVLIVNNAGRRSGSWLSRGCQGDDDLAVL